MSKLAEIRVIKVGNMKIYVHNIDGEDFVPLDVLMDVLEKAQEGSLEIEDSTSQVENTSIGFIMKPMTMNSQKVDAYMVNGTPYITVTQLGALWNHSVGATAIVLNNIEKKRREELAEKRAKELSAMGQSNIHPDKDAKLRKQFNFDKKKRFISIADAEKYFFSEAER